MPNKGKWLLWIFVLLLAKKVAAGPRAPKQHRNWKLELTLMQCLCNSDEGIKLNEIDCEESEESVDVIGNIPGNPDIYIQGVSAKMLQTSRRGRGQQDDSKYIGNAGSEMLS
ncbi:hypothetical protein TNCV_2828291 [Trichonephila clavipes]|nr:hypothetical protein TNCV_2828291 [Trichonephila clavipes]